MEQAINNKNSFDSAVQNYDEVFTLSDIGKLQRRRVYYWLDKINFFKAPKRVFEVNCGTGYDAEQFFRKGHEVTATDGSEKMISFAKQNRNKAVDFLQLTFNQVAQNEKLAKSKVLFSNFGGLNCISTNELEKFANSIAKKQKAKDLLVWVLMPKYCLMESIYFTLRLNFKKVFRRNTDQAVNVDVGDTKVKTYYHSPSIVKNMLRKNYSIKLVKPIAIFLPPSYLEPFFSKHSGWLKILNGLEKIFGRFTFLAGGSDHYIIIAEKT